jgi:protein SCO1/2
MKHSLAMASLGLGLLCGTATAQEPAGLAKATDTMRRHFGDKLPDVKLLNDRGEPVNVVTDLIKDRVVVISFFYTQCRGTCPGTGLLITKLRKELAPDFGRSLRFVSISVEPEVDDVKAIQDYAQLNRDEYDNPDMPDWHFLTGGKEDITRFRRALGYYEADPKIDADPTQHAAMLIIGNQATGRWAMIPTAIGWERVKSKIIRICGWSARQRYAEVNAELDQQKTKASASR